jgi:hypothetical protein
MTRWAPAVWLWCCACPLNLGVQEIRDAVKNDLYVNPDDTCLEDI